MSSTSANDGQMSMTVTFELGRDPDIAAVNVNNRVAVAEPRLPEEVRRFGVTVRKQSPDLTMVVNLLSPDGSRDALFLSNYALINVLDALKRVPGVGEIEHLRRAALRDAHLARSGAAREARAHRLRRDRRGARAERADRRRASRARRPRRRAAARDAAAHARAPLHRRGVRADRGPRRAGRLAAAPRRRRARRARRAELRRLHAAVRPARRSRSASSSSPRPTRSTSRAAVRAELERLSRALPVRRRRQIVRYDPTQFVSESIGEVLGTLVEAMLLVFLVVYVFLQDWRTTLIPAVTIPVSLIGTFAVLNALGSRSTRSRSSRSCSRSGSSWTTRSWWSRTSRGCSARASRAARRCGARWAR